MSGSKNSSLAIITAALLATESSEIHNVPDLTDIHTMLHLLTALGAETSYHPTSEYCGTVTICAREVSDSPPDDRVSQIRASILLAGAAPRAHKRVLMPVRTQISKLLPCTM